jgi:hypothetical protein
MILKKSSIFTTICRSFSSSTPQKLPRYTSFHNAFEEVDTLTPSTVNRMEKVYGGKEDPLHHVQIFHSVVTHSDGSTFTCKTPIPLNPRVNLVKDTLTHLLWNPRIRDAQVASTSEEFIRFQKRFSTETEENGEDYLDALSSFSSPDASEQK